MARNESQLAAERLLQTRFAALKSRIARLPQTAQIEFRPLVEDLEVQLEDPARSSSARRLLDDIRAIDVCVSFELTILLQDVPEQPTEDAAHRKSRRRRDLPATAELYGDRHQPRTNAARQST